MAHEDERNSAMASPLLPATQIDQNCQDCCRVMFSPRCLLTVQSMHGVLLAIFAAILYSAAHYCMRLVQEVGGVGPLQTSFFINMGMSICIIPIIICKSINIMGESHKERGILITIAGLYTGSLLALVKALILGSIGNVTGILRGTMPIVTPILSMIILRESYKIVDGLVTLISICGILLMARAPEIFGLETQFEEVDSHELSAYMLTVFAGTQMSLCVVLMRYSNENVLVTLCWISMFGSLSFSFFTIIFEIPKWAMDTETALVIVGMIISTLLGTVCRIKALHLIEATPVILLSNLQIVVAFLLQTYGLHDNPDFYSILGAGVILLGGTICAVNTWWRDYHHK
ncbi:solute carrier family 35 member G1-like [Saccoglossus kowalevskii]|uniref:Uncharacterized protein LOC102802063 n=1 Tax=Saccoglossus kowalevskii TaxID=10224 RepID=A0ABM0MI38_SACKO|nr:PREDICTED: uncharacterized protein LOC102802063 [Saccoglossus kowalevskii]